MNSKVALYALKRLRVHAEDPEDAMGVLLSTAQVADWLGVTRQTLDVWRHRGIGPRYVKLGNGRMAHVRYVVGDVIGWLEEVSGGTGGTAARSREA